MYAVLHKECVVTHGRALQQCNHRSMPNALHRSAVHSLEHDFTGQQMPLDALRRLSAILWGKAKASCAHRHLQLPVWGFPHTAQEETVGERGGGGEGQGNKGGVYQGG